MNNIVYISWVSLSDKMERDWFISDLLSKGVSVEYWDISLLYSPNSNIPNETYRPYVTKIQNYVELEKLLTLRDVSRHSFVILCNHEGRTNKLFRILTRYKCKLYFIEWGNFPIKGMTIGRIIKQLFSHPWNSAVSAYYAFIKSASKQLGFVKEFDVVFAAGNASMAMHPKAREIVSINLIDYENSVQSIEQPTNHIESKYCVFLDINLPFHTDLKLCKMGDIDSHNYFQTLNAFFRRIEKRYGVRTIIAAHPQSKYDADLFEGRTIIKNATPSLVKDAEFVISHHSTSLSYAVLNKKPIIFIYTDDMENIYPQTIVKWIFDFADFLHAKSYNIDRLEGMPENLPFFEPPDAAQYDLYKYNYITSKASEHLRTRDIFWKYLIEGGPSGSANKNRK